MVTVRRSAACAALSSLLIISGCAGVSVPSGPATGGAGVEGQWTDAQGVALSTFSGGQFVSVATDTGNRLFDPLTRTPVMVTELALWEEYLPEAFIQRAKRMRAEEIVHDLDGRTMVWRDRWRLVPYKGIHHGTSFMLALKPDRVIVHAGSQEYEVSKVLIGLKPDRLNSEAAYRAIIHPELVNL